MTFKADLKFSDSKFHYSIIECDYEFTQAIDETGKPCAKPRGGVITVVVESMSDPELIQWMIATGNVRSGEIVFYKDDAAQKKLKTLSFKEAICILLHERFTRDTETPMHTTISFVAKELSLDGVDYSAQWTNF
jgi:hypothetical protein